MTPLERDRGEWVDLSVPVTDGMTHWPGDPPVRVERAMDLERGDPASVTRLDMSAHTGTHVDAPAHFRAGGAGVETLPIGACVGEARVVEVRDQRAVSRERLEALDVRGGERLLIKTTNSDDAWWREPFREDFAHLSLEAARLLAERRVRCVGVDYLSVAAPSADGERVHRALLDGGVVIIEGLRLAPLEPGPHEFCCLPVRIDGADGAPARAVARRLQGGQR